MKIFEKIYDKALQWSKHRLAVYWLSLLSFIEAIFFPIPPDVMLIPMSMSKPQKAMRFAIYATIFSVVGGAIGYGVGYFASDWVRETIANWGYQGHFDRVMKWFDEYGIAIIFVAGGFSPVPYKVFTLCAGLLQMSFFPFLITSLVARASRFVMVAKLSAWGGEKYAEKIRRSIELLGWAVVIIAVLLYLVLKLK
ncbi:MAG: YqaA family protein [Pasteurellaceae bacterium]|nr:YqaA family protein [Pasteurellaceae bacterium]